VREIKSEANELSFFPDTGKKIQQLKAMVLERCLFSYSFRQDKFLREKPKELYINNCI